ncbi:MAG TPA: carbon monoxide dehydrogenase, partial [Pseudonocardiaceae bacterium]|nr:carbon monoxide dehydrogenase [Pseudonocardiaceae bacterium]
FGRGLIEDVGKKIIGQFADCLSSTLGPQDEPGPAAAEPAPSDPPSQEAAPLPAPSAQLPPGAQPAQPRLAPPPVHDEIDLLDAAGGAVAKRALPAVAALALLVVVLRWLRKARSGDRPR